MDELVINLTCPLGHTCQKVNADGEIERCRLFIMMKGKDAQGEDHDDWNCAFAWQPIIALENAQQTRQLGAGVDVMRDENAKRQAQAFHLIDTIQDKAIGFNNGN